MSGVETLSVVASIIAIVQISKTILSICHFYIDGVEGAPSDLRVILIEVSALKAIAKSLEYLTQPKIATSALLDQLAGVTGPIEGCMKVLKELEALFPLAAASSNGQKSKRQKLDTTLSVLAWPLKSGKAKKLLQEIIQHKTTINLALIAEFVHYLKEVKAKTEQIQNLLTENERNDVYRWLETTNPCDIHNRSQRLYERDTGSWVHRTPEWPLWVDGSHRCLWLHGIPGAGKSILASHLAETIEKHCRSVSTETLKLGHAYYYCYFGHNQDESSHFLRWIIGQLCRQSRKLSQDLHHIYKFGKPPSLPDLLSVLHTVIERFERVYIVLDAVDESMPRDDLLSIIHDLSTDTRFSKLSLLATSRRYLDIEDVLKNCSIPISMSNPFIEEGIRSFVRSQVQSIPRYKKWPKDLLEEMIGIIPRKAEGMFRWAVCQIDCLKRLKPQASTIKAALSNLPKTLDETYDRIFLAIPKNDWLSVQHVFHWLVYHNDLFGDNITLNTLLQAVQASTADLRSPDADQLYDFEGLRECCGCLIMVEKKMGKANRYTDASDEVNVVSFAHYTVKEYLLSSRIHEKSTSLFALAEEKVRKEFAQIVLRQAVTIQPRTLADRKQGLSTFDILTLLNDDFKTYCGIASTLQLYIWPESISSDPSSIALSEALVNPLSPSYPDLTWLLRTIHWVIDFQATSEAFIEHNLWTIDWKQDPDYESAVFLNFLVASCRDDICHLALAFAHKHPMLAVLTNQLHISKEILDVLVWNHVMDPYEFKGTIPEFAAQWAYSQPASFELILDLVSDLGVTHFDLSTLLLFYIGSHSHNDCKKSCTLERLLRLGADPNGPKGAFVTPLQIATSWWDLHGVETLLNAGADPNPRGGNDLAWAPGTLMERYNRLRGASSLCIIENYVGIFDEESMMESIDLNKTTRWTVETRLLESSAVNIESTSLDVLLDGPMYYLESDEDEE